MLDRAPTPELQGSAALLTELGELPKDWSAACLGDLRILALRSGTASCR